MLDKFSSMVAAATFVVLSLAVTHEWGYYAQFDPHIQGLVAPSDYLKSALLWLPTIAITYFVMATFTVLQWRAEDFRFGPQRGQWMVHLVGVNFLALAILSFFVSLPVDAWLVYSIAIAYVWSQIVGYVARHEEVPKRFTFGALVLIMFLPMGLAFAYSSGVREGSRDLFQRNEPTYTMISKGKEERTRSVILLRALEKGALVRDQADVQFYGWGDVLTLQLSPKPADHPHGCQLFGIRCKQ
jgi:tellurite resistance protein TehA-like permease